MKKTQNGWPALTSSDDPTLHQWEIPGSNRHVVLRYGSAGFLLTHFALWYDERVQRLDLPQQPWDEWGWAYRKIEGYGDVSNHASGTAIDLNATLYPAGLRRMVSWRRARIRARLLMYRGCLRWGGDYQDRPDQMHVEINRPLPACERAARRLMKTKRGKRVLAANPGQVRIILS